MATSSPNLKAILARQVVQRLAGGGSNPASGATGSDGADAAGEQLSAQFSELSGADPQMMSKTLTQVKGMLVAISGRTAFSIPEAARHVDQARKSIDSALKVIETASATQNATRPLIANRANLPASQDIGGQMGGGEDQFNAA